MSKIRYDYILSCAYPHVWETLQWKAALNLLRIIIIYGLFKFYTSLDYSVELFQGCIRKRLNAYLYHH